MNPTNSFPVLCQDNFFDNPDEIRKYALSLDYKTSEDGRWPGERTQLFHTLNPKLNSEILLKVFANYFDFNAGCALNWKESQVCFQKIKPYTEIKNDVENKGWIHTDGDNGFAGLIYLSPNTSLESGTSIFKLKKEYEDLDEKLFDGSEYWMQYNEELNKLYSNKDYNKEKLTKEYNGLREKFDEVITMKNVYNRMISYDGGNWHSAGDFVDEERLTLVFFVNNILSSPTPYQRSSSYDLKIRSMI